MLPRPSRPSRPLTATTVPPAGPAAGPLPTGASPAAGTRVVVDFATTRGAPTWRASGTIYGMTPDGSQPPDHFFTDVKWRFMRAGGAQLNDGGYGAGLDGYRTRWDATLAQYERTVALGGTFILLPHDLWGADSTTSQGWPGDDGNWTLFDAFVAQLLDDVRAHGMTVQWDLWNEPDGRGFWEPSQDRYLRLWSRFFARVRDAFPGHLIVGPSTASRPDPENAWWTAYLAHVAADDVAPDVYSWHDEPGDPVADVARADATLAAAGLTRTRPYQINEYATSAMQSPGGGAWFIGRLERAGADGLRGNWASGGNLHDYAANLLAKDDAGRYLPLGEWFVYRYYASQTGRIVELVPEAGIDGLATNDNSARNAKVLLGSDGATGAVTVRLTGLDTTSVVANGRVRAVVRRVPHHGGAAVTGPQTVSDTVLGVSGDAAALTLAWSNAEDAYTVTLLPPDGEEGAD